MREDNRDWDEHDRVMAVSQTKAMVAAAEKHKRWLSEVCQRISKEHRISNGRALRDLLAALYSLPLDKSSSPDFDNWSIPKGLPAWKDVKSKLVEFTNHLRSARAVLSPILDDPVLRAALMQSDEDRQLPGLIVALHEFTELDVSAASISGKQGNRPHPDWQIEATDLCRQFWRKHKTEKPTSYFNRTTKPKAGEKAQNTTQPGNPFSKWFCDVMAQLFRMTPSQCQTLLRQKEPRRL